jgi:hypothetical protein
MSSELGAALALDLLSSRTPAQDEPGGDGADTDYRTCNRPDHAGIVQ